MITLIFITNLAKACPIFFYFIPQENAGNILFYVIKK